MNVVDFFTLQIKDESQNPAHLYILPSAQCDAETLDDIANNKRLFEYEVEATRGKQLQTQMHCWTLGVTPNAEYSYSSR